MGFGAEMKDFLSAAETGVRIKLNSAARRKTLYDIGEKPGFDPNSPSTLAGGGGAGGGVGTTTAPQVAGSGGDKTASTTKGGTNAFGKQAYDFYRGKGLSHAHAAGIVGNLMGESGGDPNVLNGVRAGDSGHSWYAGQWNGKRLDNLLAFAKQQHPDSPQPTTTDQLGFVLEESNSKSPFYDAGAGKAFQLASQAQTVDQATDAYMTHYERPRDRSSFKRRVEYASGFVDDGSGGDGAAPAAETPEANKAGPPAPTADSGGDDGSGDSGMLQPQVDIIEPPAEQDVEAPQVETDPALFGTGLYAPKVAPYRMTRNISRRVACLQPTIPTTRAPSMASTSTTPTAPIRSPLRKRSRPRRRCRGASASPIPVRLQTGAAGVQAVPAS